MQRGTTVEIDDLLARKRRANAFLPALAVAFAREQIGLDDLCAYFRSVAHLYTVGIDVNAVCNLTCRYCYLANYNRRTAPHYIELRTLFRFVDEVVANGVDLIAIVGKEPFADHRGVVTLRHLHELRQSGFAFRYGVVTNGTLVHRYIDDLPPTINYIDVSLDGAGEITDNIRGPGVYTTAKHNLRLLVERGFETWISSVMHRETISAATLKTFYEELSSESGCTRFYFSPVRNFTGSLQPFLLTYEEINDFQRTACDVAESIPALERVILDHPYESVWRDYVFANDSEDKLAQLRVDAYGNILHQLSSKCFRKLDVFPHGPWGTCRVDAQGEYLADVEARALEHPSSVTRIGCDTVASIHGMAMHGNLYSMLVRFVANISRIRYQVPAAMALDTLSMPENGNDSRRTINDGNQDQSAALSRS